MRGREDRHSRAPVTSCVFALLSDEPTCEQPMCQEGRVLLHNSCLEGTEAIHSRTTSCLWRCIWGFSVFLHAGVRSCGAGAELVFASLRHFRQADRATEPCQVMDRVAACSGLPAGPWLSAKYKRHHKPAWALIIRSLQFRWLNDSTVGVVRVSNTPIRFSAMSQMLLAIALFVVPVTPTGVPTVEIAVGAACLP